MNLLDIILGVLFGMCNSLYAWQTLLHTVGFPLRSWRVLANLLRLDAKNIVALLPSFSLLSIVSMCLTLRLSSVMQLCEMVTSPCDRLGASELNAYRLEQPCRTGGPFLKALRAEGGSLIALMLTRLNYLLGTMHGRRGFEKRSVRKNGRLLPVFLVQCCSTLTAWLVRQRLNAVLAGRWSWVVSRPFGFLPGSAFWTWLRTLHGGQLRLVRHVRQLGRLTRPR